MIRHGRHVPSQCPKQKHFPPGISNHFQYFQGERACNIRHGAMFLASALNRGSHPLEILKMASNTGGKCFCLGHWLGTWRP